MMLTPFLACAYMTAAATNGAALAMFGNKEAGVVLVVTGLCFHVGMSVARTRVGPVRDRYYLPGRVRAMSIMQGSVGVVQLLAGGVMLMLA